MRAACETRQTRRHLGPFQRGLIENLDADPTPRIAVTDFESVDSVSASLALERIRYLLATKQFPSTEFLSNVRGWLFASCESILNRFRSFLAQGCRQGS